MKRALVLSLCALSGCLDFDALLDGGCAADASWAECRPQERFVGDANFCSSSNWCWENPGPFGATDLFAVWGTSDTDVWVAGSGGAILHFDGTSWAPSLVSLAPTLGMTAPEPTARAVAVDDAGVAWLVGEEMKVFALRPDGSLVGSYGAVSNRVGVSSFAGTTWFVSAGGTQVELGRAAVGASPLFMSRDLNGADNNATQVALTTSAGGVFIAYNRTSPNSTGVLDVTNTVEVGLQTPNTSDVRDPRSFATLRGQPVLACTSGDLFERAGSGWNWKGQYSLGPEALTSHAFDALPDGGFRWWVTGATGSVGSLEDFGAGLVVERDPNGSALFGTWVSPSGHLWTVGLDGRVYEVEPSMGPPVIRSRGAPADFNLVDVAVRANRAVAVGRGGVRFSREATTGRWLREADPSSPDYRAVALGPGDEVCTLDLLGHVVCDGAEVQGDDLFLADGGLAPLGDRGGAMAIRSDGGAVAALGDIVLTRSGSVWQRFDAGITTPHVNDLALLPNGFAVVTNELTPNFDLGNGRLVIFDGAARHECQPGSAALAGVARTANGFAVVGFNLVGECSLTGTFTPLNAPQREWVSVWVDATGAWWILDRSGVVLRRPSTGGAWQRERLPVGGSSIDGPSAVRITGDDDEVYVVCKQGGVIRRALP